MKSIHVARIHRAMCASAFCSQLDQIDYLAGCCQCLQKHYPDWDCDAEAAASGSAAVYAAVSSANLQMGPATWHQLHARSLGHGGSDDSSWLAEFILRVPNISCSCRQHARDYIESHPPRWGDYFAWTVDFHNAVNARLGKPLLSGAEARSIWSGLTTESREDAAPIL